MPPEPGPENLADVLGKLFTSRGWGKKGDRTRLEAAWAAAAGPQIAAQTRVLKINRQVLEIEVKTAVLLQELAQFGKRPLLAAVREQLPGVTVKDLKFRPGAW